MKRFTLIVFILFLLTAIFTIILFKQKENRLEQRLITQERTEMENMENTEAFDVTEENLTMEEDAEVRGQTKELEKTEESSSTALEEMESPSVFEGFEDMDYALFLETAFIDDGGDYSYARYGIFGDFTSTMKEGENIYFLLNEKVLGNEMSFSNYIEWRNYSGERIITVTPDLQWIISRSYEKYFGAYHEKWHWERKEVKTLDGNIGFDMRAFIPRKTCVGEYEAIQEDVMNRLGQMLNEIYFGSYNDFTELDEHWICFDEYGQLLAMRELKEDVDDKTYEENSIYGPIYTVHKENCIRIYDISKDPAELLYELTLPETEVVWPIEISQIVGTREEGWIVFSAGDVTYRMSYPDGRTQNLGEFMYRTTFSPNGRYMAYCTGHNTLYNSWEQMEVGDDACRDQYYEMMDRWDAVAPGWYVEDLETGNMTYIPIKAGPDSRRIYGGRCIWIEKDKLSEILDL